jgi:hypothetical protein
VLWSADAVTASGRPHGRGRQRETSDGSTESETPGMHGNSMHGNQEIPGAPAALRKQRAGRGTHKGAPFLHAAGKSDHCVVPEKVPNKRRKACGGTGGKAVDQGEQHEGTHEPDPERDQRVPGTAWGAGSRTERFAATHPR